MTIQTHTDILVEIESNLNIDSVVYNGARGKSAWEIWVEEGHTGPDGGITYEDFLQWLRIQTARETLVEDVGEYYESDNVEDVLQEIATMIKGQDEASEITIDDEGGFFASNNVEGALQELGVIARTYDYHQTQASSEWIIVHNLNKYPSVRTFDDQQYELIGNVFYISRDEVRIEFSAEFSGTAYLN